MENKVVDNREEQRIAQDAKLYVINTHDICIDGRVIDHYTENQFHQHNEASYIAGATKEAKRNKEDAIGFIKWAYINHWRYYDSDYDYWKKGNVHMHSEQLYNEYINQKV